MDNQNLNDSSGAATINEAPSSPQSEETIGIPELSSGVTASSEVDPLPSVPISPSFDTEKEQESCGHVADSVVSATENNVGISASSSRSSQGMGQQESSPRNLSDDQSMMPSPIGQHSNAAVSNEFDEKLDDESLPSGNLGHAAAPGTVTSVLKVTQPPTSDVEQDLSDDDTEKSFLDMNNPNAEFLQQLLVVLALLVSTRLAMQQVLYCSGLLEAFMAWQRIGAGSGPPFGLDFGTRCVICDRQLYPGPIGSTDQCRECYGQICSACAGRRHDCP